MPRVIVNFEVFCSCGAGLHSVSRTQDNGRPYITVDPCEKCMERKCGKCLEQKYEEGRRSALEASDDRSQR